QTQNDKEMPLRMAEYYVALKRRHRDKPVKQIVVFVGDGKLSMPDRFKEDCMDFCYKVVDIKTINCKELLESDNLEDKMLAVLCDVRDFEGYITTVVDELLKLPEKERADYLRRLLIMLDYRPKLMVKLNSLLEERKMPLTITEEMLEKNPFFQKGKEKGKQEGLQEGKLEAKKEAIVSIYKELNLPAEKIAKMLNVSEGFVEKVLKEKNLLKD
ncbi:MAG: hypothetical protein GXO45_02970, partial [Aquificae bacterium]|nr:hypothetical protein [Aquificota bacterium]